MPVPSESDSGVKAGLSQGQGQGGNVVNGAAAGANNSNNGTSATGTAVHVSNSTAGGQQATSPCQAPVESVRATPPQTLVHPGPPPPPASKSSSAQQQMQQPAGGSGGRPPLLPTLGNPQVNNNGTTGITNGAGSPEAEDKPCKMFVGGLSWQTTTDVLTDFFEENFGEVLECNIMKDPVSKRSRGFGFITFADPETVDKVLQSHRENPICLDEKIIDPKVAVPPKRANNNNKSYTTPQTRRIFVGGLSSDSCDEDLREYFNSFGKVADVQLMYDRNTNRHRGFGFVSFESEKPAEKVCSIQYHDIKGKKVEVKVAQTKEALAMQGRGRGALPTRAYLPYYTATAAAAAAANYQPFYPPYPFDYIMGGYPHQPLILDGKGDNERNFPQYQPNGYLDQRMNGGYFQGFPPSLLPGPMDHLSYMGQDMNFFSEQFQGALTLSGSYPTSPPLFTPAAAAAASVMPQMIDSANNNGSSLSSSAGSSHSSNSFMLSSSPPHTTALSPPSNGEANLVGVGVGGGSGCAATNGFNSQVPNYSSGLSALSISHPTSYH